MRKPSRKSLPTGAILIVATLLLILVAESNAEPPVKLFLSCLIGLPALVRGLDALGQIADRPPSR
jgi:hypothetical protein